MKKLLLTQMSLVLSLAACQSAPTTPVQQTPGQPAGQNTQPQVQPGETPANTPVTPGSSAATPSGSRPTPVIPDQSTVTPGNNTTTPATSPAAPAATQVIQARNYNTETLIAGLRSGVTQAQAQQIAQRHGLSVQRYLPELNSVILTTQGQAIPTLMTALKAEAQLEFVETDQVAVQQPGLETAVGGFGLLSEDGAADTTTDTADETADESADDTAATGTDESETETTEPAPSPTPAPIAPKDPLYAQQYSLGMMNVPKAWELFSPVGNLELNFPGRGTATAPMVRASVGIIDAGVELEHGDLVQSLHRYDGAAARTFDTFDAYSRTETPAAGDVSRLNYFKTSYKQGTHSAGIIAAGFDNSKGIVGIAPQAVIMPIKTAPDLLEKLKSLFLPSDDQQYTLVSVMAEGVIWAANEGVDVLQINTPVKEQSALLKRAIDFAVRKDVVIVVPVGDKPAKDKTPAAPEPELCINPSKVADLIACDAADAARLRVYNYLATLENVIAVGAVDKDGKQAAFSPAGPLVTVVAPGVDVISSVPALLGNNSYAKRSSTAVAASQVAGVLALMVGRDRYPVTGAVGTRKPAADYRRLLIESAADKGDTGRDDIYGHGLVDAYRALGGQ